MSIELTPSTVVKNIAWLNAQPSDEARAVFAARDFVVSSCTPADLSEDSYLRNLSGLVVTQDPKDLSRIGRELAECAHRVLDFGCQIVLRSVCCGLPKLTKIVERLKIPVEGLHSPLLTSRGVGNAVPPAPSSGHFDENANWNTVANFVSKGSSRFPPNLALVIDSPDLQFDSGDEALIRRAFWDCSEVHLSRIMKGNSRVAVYRVCCRTEGSATQWLQPFFIKLGDRGKIVDEYRNYVLGVERYVPFHLGPHVVRERCCLGGRKGILVGDFVEESEDLCDCAPSGRSTAAIACLFDKTLAGWHSGAQSEEKSISAGFLARFPMRISARRLKVARRLGSKLEPKDLQRLFRRCTSTPVLTGYFHGDLHAGNVRVRATDAIIIDFLQHNQKRPLVYDAACLEASLLVDGFGEEERTEKDWFSSVESLYSAPGLIWTKLESSPKEKSFWFHASVHQIRRYARQWELGEHQYAGALAFALLCKATKDPGVTGSESYRRAAAYVFAEKILTNTFGQQAAVPMTTL